MRARRGRCSFGSGMLRQAKSFPSFTGFFQGVACSLAQVRRRRDTLIIVNHHEQWRFQEGHHQNRRPVPSVSTGSQNSCARPRGSDHIVPAGSAPDRSHIAQAGD